MNTGGEERKFGNWLYVYWLFELYGYVIEWLRRITVLPLVDFMEWFLHMLQSFTASKPKRKDKRVRRFAEDSITHCLNSSSLSFFDTFSCVNGVPAYFLEKPRATHIRQGAWTMHDAESSEDALEHSEEARPDVMQESGFATRNSELIKVCCFSSDNSLFAICYISRDVTVWDTNTGMMFAETKIKDTPASSVSFLDTSNSVLLVCTREHTCWKWEIDNKDSGPLKIYEKASLSIIEGEIFSQRSDFCANGTKLVISTIVSCDEGLTLGVTLIDMLADHDECKPCHLSPVSMEDNYVISTTMVSSNEKSILVGLMDQALEDSYCLLWPNFVEDPTIYKRLDEGTTGSWSSDSRYAITWIMTNTLNPNADDENSTFIWNVEKMRENLENDDYFFKPKKITNLFGDKVFWCQMIQDPKEKNRLIMGISGESTRFLFWDVETDSYTHIIETGISAKDMILCNKEAWIESCVRQKNIKGLSPIDVKSDGSVFGAVLGLPRNVSMWDARIGIEVMKVSPKALYANEFKGGIDLMMSPSSSKFAIIGNNGVMLFCPSSPKENKQRPKNCLETQMVQLDNLHIRHDNLSDFTMNFSGDGESLGVLCVGLPRMQVWNLPQGTSCTIKSAYNTEGAKIHNFCLSRNGQYLAVYTDKCIEVMEYKAEEDAQVIGVINVDSHVASMGIKDDASEVVLCMEDSSIYLYELSLQVVQHDEENVPSTSNIHEFVGQDLSLMKRFKLWFKKPCVDVNEPLIDNNNGDSQSASGHTSIHIRHDTPSFTYTRQALAEELDEASFQVSPNFEEVIRISRSQGVKAWDLKTRMELKDAVGDIPSTKKTSHSYSRVSSITEKMSNELISKRIELLRGTSIDLSKRTTLVQSTREDIVVAGNSSSQGFIQRSTCNVYDFQYNEEKQEDSHSIYVINLKHVEHRRRLSGYNLDPGKGLAISHDGRHVACLAGDNASKVVVWNVYASERLLHDYNFLSLNLGRDMYRKEGIKQEVQPLIDELGVNFFNVRHSSGMSIFEKAICNFNINLMVEILQYVLKKKIMISFLMRETLKKLTMESRFHNMIEVSIVRRSPKMLAVMLKYLLKRVTHEVEVDAILSHSLVELHNVYPTLFMHAIRYHTVLRYGHDIEVPESRLARRKFICTTSDSLLLSEKEASEVCKKELNYIDQDVNQSIAPTIMATVLTLPFTHACKTSCQGLLHKLLSNRVHLSLFDAFSIHAIVDYKWREFGKELLIQEFAHHLALLGAYMAYCFTLCTDGTYKMAAHVGSEENSSATRISLLVCWLLAVPCLHRELRQCTLYVSKDGCHGFFSWLGSTWNWMEVLSYLVIVILIPLAEFFFLRKGRKSIVLSSLVALESLLLWSRVLYYARTMPRIGKFVTVISSVVAAVVPFLFVAFCVMFGFAIAFHVLYRHVAATMIGEGENSDDGDLEALHRSFGTFGRTLFTVFGFTFGEFDLDEIYHAPSGSIVAIVFVLYMVTVSTTLLNMLIAVMTNEFNGIRDPKDSRFIQARAMAIEDNESMMTSMWRTKTNERIGKYLHIITPTFGHEKLFRGSRQFSTVTMDSMTKAFRRLIREELAKPRRWGGASTTQLVERRVIAQNTLTPYRPTSDTIQESGISFVAPVEVRAPPSGIAEQEPYWSDSDSTYSEYAD